MNLATVASAGGSDRNQGRFVNLMHNPEATVTIKRETRRVRARAASPGARKVVAHAGWALFHLTNIRGRPSERYPSWDSRR